MRKTWRWLHPYAQVVGQHATDLLVEAHGPINGRHAMEPIEPNGAIAALNLRAN